MSAPLPVEERGDGEEEDRRQKGPDHGPGHAARPEAGILHRCCCVFHDSRSDPPLAHIFARL